MLKMNRIKKLLCLIGCVVLVAALALNITGCGSKTEKEAEPVQTEAVSASGNVLGEGATVFTVVVTDTEGKETSFEIHTDKETVGEALLDVGLIAGEDSEFGLYVTTVNGTTLDWDKDQKYWAFYIDGEYAQTGVDSTTVAPGTEYSFKAEG